MIFIFKLSFVLRFEAPPSRVLPRRLRCMQKQNTSPGFEIAIFISVNMVIVSIALKSNKSFDRGARQSR